jgi:phenylacetate-CoA ligase
MVNIRGVNVYPTAVESVVRRFAEVVEFRTTVSQAGALRRLALEVELAAGDPAVTTAELTRSLREALGLNVPVEIVGAGTLPRFEMKARRFVIQI